MSSSSIDIHGFAIVSADDRIAGPDGVTPPSLRNDADWAYFQRELNAADLVALGRRGHEVNANAMRRRRLVLSRRARGLEWRGEAWWWNPADIQWREAAAKLLPDGGRVAVAGGQGVFDLFMAIGYQAFHLSQARRVRLGAGRTVFAACESGLSAGTALAGAGLRPGAVEVIDAAADVTLTVWRR
jgi:hypothetical protein